jgi:hypothetical protein
VLIVSAEMPRKVRALGGMPWLGFAVVPALGFSD